MFPWLVTVNDILPSMFLANGEIQWCFSQVKGTLDDEITEGKV